ncbi:AP-4 complex subunit epsilon-1 isoform X3 [Strongylocentrotus purpuratus]|uniref:AP-4 complex subunit epsilon-1 C-terminal domain-containing protein n=1 Tax=Strongylocentrotus purpuratus TaxID=7668 RepID=A0A7M7MXK4_STRPU|nr:AP-4 complex subunit epsilon-1 isoform X3 [Strongylocentrotus purpuratus]
MDKALSYSGFIGGPRNTAISSGFYSLIRAIRRSNSKGEEERIVQKELDLIRQNLSQPDVSLKKMKEFMVRLIYCEMLGQSANFAYIHAIKMAQQGVLLNKRVGYLGVSLFLHSQHELILLLINTIQKDLNSTNVLDVCGGLTACGNLIGAEMVPVVLPLIEQNLQHPQTSLMMYDVLEEVLDSSNTLSLISCGVQYECIMTIANIHPKLSLLKKTSICITRFLKSQSNNLRYLGVNALGVIHKVHPEFSREHQMTVVECLEDEDPTIKQATMNLLYEMCSADNISVILDKVLDHLISSSMETFDHSEHINKMVSLAHQFHPSIRWYVIIIVKILNLCGTNIPANTINNLITSIQMQGNLISYLLHLYEEPKEAGLISYLVEEMLTVANQTHLSEDLIKLIVWILGEFSHSEMSTVPGSEALAGLVALLSKTMSPTTRCCVVAAITKAVLKSGLVSENVTKTAVTLHAQNNIHVKQGSYELEVLCSDPELISALPNITRDQFDWTLSFLDGYVSEALGNGAAPYKPKQQRSAEKHNSPEVMRPFLSGLNFSPYALNSASVMTPTESSSSVTLNNQEAASVSWSPSQSLSSDATGSSIDVELATRPSLKTEGIQKLWSQTGYSRKKEGNRKRLSPNKNNTVQATQEDGRKDKQPAMHMTPVIAVGMSTLHTAESEEDKRKQELAKALFGAVRTQTEKDEIPPQPQIKHSTERVGPTSSEAFADYCTEEGLMIHGETGQNILLDVGIQSGEDDESTTQHHLLNLYCTNKLSDSNTTKLDTLQENVGDVETKSNHGFCLLDGGESLPSLPVDLETYPRSQVAEELVFDTNVRLMMRRVWQTDALVIVFYISALVAIDEARITLDVPSNMKCMIDDKETNLIDIPRLGVTQAKLMCHVPAAHMSLGGELTFKDATKTLKRLFFHAPIHIEDLLRAKEITTEEFGKLWRELSLDQRFIQEANGLTISRIMNKMTSIHMFPVEIIGEEGILAASLLQSSICLIHIKLNNNKLDIWVKSRSKLLSQVLANKCASLIEQDQKN